MTVKQQVQEEIQYKKRVNTESKLAEEEAIKLAKEYRLLNEKKNALAKKEEDARVALYTHCKANGIKIVVDNNDKPIAKVFAKTGNDVDISKLREFLTLKKIVDIASVAQSSLKGVLPDNEIKTCLVQTTSAENVHLVK